MANDSVGVAAAGTPTNYIDNESISTGGSPATVDRQRVRVGGSGYADLADVVQGDSGQNMQVFGGGRKEVAFSVTSNTSFAVTDCSNYRWVSIQATISNGASVNFQGSNDNVTWWSFVLTQSDAPGTTASSYAGSLRAYSGPIPFRYFRLLTTGYTSGTVAGTVEFFTQAPGFIIQPVYISALGTNVPVTFAGVPSDSLANNAAAILPSSHLFYNGATWERARTPSTFKSVTATASGDTALWTPTTGKKFRLMRFKIEATADAATSGGAGIDVVLRDATTATAAAMSFYAPATSVTTNPGVISTGWIDLGNGVLSASANQVLNVNLSAALTSGKVRVVACGTEE